MLRNGGGSHLIQVNRLRITSDFRVGPEWHLLKPQGSVFGLKYGN